jgi:hypothetical protein
MLIKLDMTWYTESIELEFPIEVQVEICDFYLFNELQKLSGSIGADLV